MFKFAFSVILVGAIYQAFVLSMPVDSGPSLSQGLEIVGKAAMDIFKSGGELANSVTTSIQYHWNSLVKKSVKLMLMRMSILSVASGELTEFFIWNKKTPADVKRYQVIAKSVEEIVGKLDCMEQANKLIRQTTRKVLNPTTEIYLDETESKSMFEALDKDFKAEKGLQDIYKKLREKNEREIPLPKLNGPKNAVEEFSHTKNQAKSFLNLLFLYYIDDRLSITRDHFIVARSIVELAKDPQKLETVQRIYDGTLLEIAEVLDLKSKMFQATASILMDTLFRKLKENLEKNPSIWEDFEVMRKNVSGRRDWVQGAWDLPW